MSFRLLAKCTFPDQVFMTPGSFARHVTQQLQQAGYQALWAGGCVRDQLLGIEPGDYDVATSATPDQVRELFGYRKTLPLGAAFGVITVLGPRSAGNVEVATFRSDGHYLDGRHPESVTWGTAELDARRRDFTINGLFFDPIREEIFDFVEGKQDLENRIVRAIGDPASRFDEDKLRMLRAVRFAASMEFVLDAATLESIQEMADGISTVSAERIGSELTLMLVNRNRRRAVELLAESRLLTRECLFPELRLLVKNPSEFEKLLDRLHALKNPELPECLAALVADVAKFDEIPDLGRRLKLSNDVAESAAWILRHRETLGRAHQLPWSVVQPVLVDQRVAHGLRFLEADQGVENPIAESVGFCRQRLAWPIEQLDPKRLVDGKTLQSMGLSPGPAFSRILGTIRQMQLDDEIRNTDQAILVARELCAHEQADKNAPEQP